jgi:tetratricopeptide (TPR) repeat protein
MMTLFSLGETHYQQAQNAKTDTERLAHLKEAEWNFERVTNINTDFLLGFYKLSESLWEQDRFADALKVLDTAIEVHPEDIILYYSRALALEKLERNAEAIETYQHIITLQPKFSIAYHNLGELYLSQDEPAQAEALYKQAIEQNDLTGAQANGFRMSLAELYINQSRWAEAQAQLVKVISAEPDNFMAYLGLGHLQFEQKQFDKALVLYTKASELNPDHAETYYYLSLTLQALNREDEALAQGMHYISLEPKGELAQKTMARLASLKTK